MIKLDKHLPTFILVIYLVTTVLNHYFITDDQTRWNISLSCICVSVFLLVLFRYLNSKTFFNLSILILFASELFAVILGFNLDTLYFPELLIGFILILLGYGIYKRH